MNYANDIDDGVFDYSNYGHTVFRPKKKWTDRPRIDIISFDKATDTKELESSLVLGKDTSPVNAERIKGMIRKYWDCFCLKGTKRTILDYEFAIDTGASKPVCCRKPTYGPHEAPIIMEQIQMLLNNDWIRECKGAWGSQIVLAAKPHQEHIQHIKDFVWRLCISYRGLNRVTKPFQYPIPRCDLAITLMAIGSGKTMDHNSRCTTRVSPSKGERV